MAWAYLLGYAQSMDRETGPETEETGSAAPVSAREKAKGSLVPMARPFMAGLGSDPRMPVWIFRTIAALAVGITISVFTDWRLGLTGAIVVVIADMIYRSKTMGHIPAEARVTSAQRKTRRRLTSLKRAGYVTLNICTIPGSDSVIDHLVIGPSGVVALDSEYWDRRLPIRVGGVQLYHGPYNQKSRLLHARWEAARAGMLVGAEIGRPLKVRPAMAVYGPKIPWGVAELRGVDVFSGKKVARYFRQRSKVRRRPRPGTPGGAPMLTADEVEEIARAASRVLPPA